MTAPTPNPTPTGRPLSAVDRARAEADAFSRAHPGQPLNLRAIAARAFPMRTVELPTGETAQLRQASFSDLVLLRQLLAGDVPEDAQVLAAMQRLLVDVAPATLEQLAPAEMITLLFLAAHREDLLEQVAAARATMAAAPSSATPEAAAAGSGTAADRSAVRDAETPYRDEPRREREGPEREGPEREGRERRNRGGRRHRNGRGRDDRTNDHRHRGGGGDGAR